MSDLDSVRDTENHNLFCKNHNNSCEMYRYPLRFPSDGPRLPGGGLPERQLGRPRQNSVPIQKSNTTPLKSKVTRRASYASSNNS